jgi:hypothetical protein
VQSFALEAEERHSREALFGNDEESRVAQTLNSKSY